MSLADGLIKFASHSLNFVHSDVWRIESGANAGTTFIGITQTESPIVFDGDLGSDAREKTVLFVDRPAPALDRGMVISGKGCKWSVVGDVDDNPANHSIKFEIAKIVPGKDS